MNRLRWHIESEPRPEVEGGVLPFRKQAGAVKFTEAQMAWLHLVRDHIATSVHLDRDDLELGTMGQQGGLAKMYQLFGEEMDTLIDELNETLAA